MDISSSERKDWVLTQGAFDKMLAWLDTDRNLAGEKYEKLRIKLIKIFTCRGCDSPEDLADGGYKSGIPGPWGQFLAIW